MRLRHAVLLTASKSSHPSELLSCQQRAAISPLAATLMNLPASVANKRLTAWLSPLAATLTKNTGRGPRLSTFRPSDVPTFQRTLHSLLSLSAQRVFHNSFAFTGIRTLSKNCRVYPNSSLSGTAHSSLVTILKFFFFTLLRTLLRFFARTQNSTHLFSIASALFAKNTRGWGRERLAN